MATTLRKDAKDEIIKRLRQQGYATYANLVELFDIYLTDDPEVVGYMIPDKAKIVLNKELSIEQVSTLVRHEILHEFLTHMKRQQEFHDKNPKYLSNHQIANIAADFEISNLGYTDEDKRIAKRIKLGEKVVQCLVTDLDRPGWEDLTFEQMYEKLLEEQEMTKDALEQLLQKLAELSKQDLDDMKDQAASMEGDNSEGESKPGESGEGTSSDTKSGDSDKENDSSDGSDKASDKDSTSEKAAKIKDEIQKQAGKIKKAIDNIQKQQDEYHQSQSAEGEVFPTKQEQIDQVEVSARVAQIEKALNDLKNKQKLFDEVAVNRQKEQAKKQAREIERVRGSGLGKFKMALNRFIANEIVSEYEDTYRRLDPRYEDTDFLMPGRIEKDPKHIPVVAAYWDASGSFSPPEKTAAARKAIETLTKYDRAGDLKLDVWYHGGKVARTREEAGGWNNGNEVMRHIKETKPDNVIIITDGDLSDTNIPVTVPGAVWMLFYDMRSSGLMNSLHGKRETKYFDIEYKK